MNDCRTIKIKYVGEFCRLKIYSLALQRDLNWRSNVACLSVKIHRNRFYAYMNLVKFIFKSFVSCNLQFQAFYVRNSTVYRSNVKRAQIYKPLLRPRHVDFPLGQVTFCRARAQASRSPTKFLIAILKRKR